MRDDTRARILAQTAERRTLEAKRSGRRKRKPRKSITQIAADNTDCQKRKAAGLPCPHERT
jgi:hypothetical protein